MLFCSPGANFSCQAQVREFDAGMRVTTVPSLAEITLLFLRVGNTTVGGGEPTIAVFQRELSRRGWLSPEQFGIAYGLARLTPGTNMLAFCAAAAWFAGGTPGAIAGVLAVTIPSSALVVWLTHICELGDQVAWLHRIVTAVTAAAVGTMIAAAYLLIRRQCSKKSWLLPLAIVAGVFGLRQVGLSPLQILGIAAVLGAVIP